LNVYYSFDRLEIRKSCRHFIDGTVDYIYTAELPTYGQMRPKSNGKASLVKFSRLVNRPSAKSWVILARGANDDIADMHVGRLGDNMVYGIGDVIAYQQWAELLAKYVHHLFTVARCGLKPT